MIVDTLQCGWAVSHFLVLSENVFSSLVYYSHFFSGIAAILLGVFVYRKNWTDLSTKVFFTLTLVFALWIFSDIVLWADPDPRKIMFFWSLTILLEPVIYILALYFLMVYGNGTDVGVKTKSVLLALLLPTAILTPTSFAILGFNYTNCDREVIEGLLVYYGYLVEVCIALWAVVYSLRTYKTISKEARKGFVVVATGTILFLLALAWGNIVGTLSEDWTLGQYGLFGMPVFLALMTYALARYQAFHLKTLSAQLLVGAVWVLVGSLLFLTDFATIRIVIAITLVALIPFGILLVQSVKREVTLREQTQKLAAELEVANKRQQETLRFITHEVKGYLTDGAAALDALLTNMFGPISDDMRSMLTEALTKNRSALREIQNFLRIADFKTGKVSYVVETFDFKEKLAEALEPLTENAKHKGLSFHTDIATGDYTATGDSDQLINHVIGNLVNNAINYTPKGEVLVKLSRTDGSFLFSVKDSGVGLSDDDKALLFTEGGHGKESRAVNPHSTGYGLFIAKKIVEAHRGRIWAESEGRGKGSTFFVELPAALSPEDFKK